MLQPLQGLGKRLKQDPAWQSARQSLGRTAAKAGS